MISKVDLSHAFPRRIDQDLGIHLLRLTDAEELYRLVDSNRSHLRQWLPFVDHYRSVDDASAFIDRCLERYTKQSGLGIGLRYRNSLAGVATYDYLDWDNSMTRIGYWLGKEFEGRGLMTRTCRALTDLAIDEMGLNRVEIWCAAENERCRRVPERLGFKLEGTFRQRERVSDKYLDMVSYSILEVEWKSPIQLR